MLEASAETTLQLFELGPGKMLDLQINNPLPVRLKLSLVGYDLGRYIILKYPRVANNSEYNDVLIEGNGVIVRYLLEGDKDECFAFSSSVRSVTQHPVDGEIKIMAQICNSRNENGEISVGIKFMDNGNLVPKLLSQLFIV